MCVFECLLNLRVCEKERETDEGIPRKWHASELLVKNKTNPNSYTINSVYQHFYSSCSLMNISVLHIYLNLRPIDSAVHFLVRKPTPQLLLLVFFPLRIDTANVMWVYVSIQSGGFTIKEEEDLCNKGNRAWFKIFRSKYSISESAGC